MELSEKSQVVLNKLANLYLNAIYIYGFICDILEVDPPLKNVGECFEQKNKNARICTQVKILIHMYTSCAQTNKNTKWGQ